MSNLAIRAERLGKRYRIGAAARKLTTAREAIAHFASAPFRNLTRLRRLSSFRDGDTTDIIWALRDVSFQLTHGEAIGIIGQNGAGKSTLLKVVSRITEPTTGRLELHGRVGSLLEVGTGFHPELTGRDNIFLNGSILGMDRSYIKRRFAEIVDFAGVEKFIDTPVKRYSSGMYVRLAFAVAAHLEPEILIVDEVLAVGDAAFQRKCLGKMNSVVGEGRTVLFVSHNMNAIEGLCRRALYLDGGSVARDGEAHAVINHYLQAAASSATDRYWPDLASAPGNERARLHRARVRPLNGSADDLITVDTDVLLEFEYWNLVAGARLNLSLHVRTLDGIIAFNTWSGEEPGWQDYEFPVGLYRNECRIPGGLLNDAEYRIELLVVEDSTDIAYRHEDVLVFAVRNVVQPGVGWHGRVPGVVRPTLVWKTECLTRQPARL